MGEGASPWFWGSGLGFRGDLVLGQGAEPAEHVSETFKAA